MAFRIGSWGTPEFGITEAIGSLLGKRTDTTSGGSQLIGTPYTANTVSTSPSLNPYAGGVSKTTPQVQGASTSYSGGGNTALPQNSGGGTPSGPSVNDIYRQQMEGTINSGYNDYFNSLDQMLGGLGGQRTAQENIAENSFNTSLKDLGLQRDQNQADLNTQVTKTEQGQVKTLKDISSNIRNLMTAGNTYLGAQGAGDSSAVNQYAYGLTKLGSQQRGDVQSQTAGILSDIADRGSKLNNVFMQEKNRLEGEKNTAIQGIAQWFGEAQNQLVQAKANGQLSKSQDLQSLTTNLYNQAVQQLTAIQQQAQQKQASLESWAQSNATNLAQLKQNMAGIGAYQAPQQQAGQIQGSLSFAPQGAQGSPVYGGSGQSYDDIIKQLSGLA